MLTKLSPIILAIFLTLIYGGKPIFSETPKDDFPKTSPSIGKLDVKSDIERIVKANPEVAGLKFSRTNDYESSESGQGYNAVWKNKGDFFEIHILTFGRRDIATSFNVKDAGQYINAKSVAILSFLQMRQRERDNDMQDDGVSELTVGKYKILTRFLKYSVRGIPVNNVILSTSLNGKIIGFNIVLAEKSEDEAKTIIKSIINTIPHLLNPEK